MSVSTPNIRGGKPVLLDTLAQLTQPAPIQAGGGVIFGRKEKKKGSILVKRAKSKYITDGIAIRLAGIKSDLHSSYERTLYCCGFMLQEGNKLTGKYCNGRWCLTCNRIRTAKLMNGYLPQIEGWANKYLLTLTVPNVTGEQLHPEIRKMYFVFRNICRQLRRPGNKKRFGFKAVRKLEATYNDSDKTVMFHPHFHLVISNRAAALFILSAWADAFPAANWQAQDLRRADNNGLKELFKYSTKLVVKSKSKKGNTINPGALDVIFSAMKGLRTFQALGVRKVSEDVEQIESQVYDELQERKPGDPVVKIWRWYGEDWVNYDTGETLTGHRPTLNSYSVVNNST